MSCGVLLGSILGPLLFIINIYTITTVQLSTNAKLTLYADDLCLRKEVSSQKLNVSKFNEILKLSGTGLLRTVFISILPRLNPCLVKRRNIL